MNYESVPPPFHRVEDGGALVLRAGGLVGLAVAGALASTLPGALRVASALGGDVPAVRAWAALVASALAPMLVSILLLRGARQGLSIYLDPVRGLQGFGIGLWLAALLVTLSLFGSLLRATTHHHALAAVTYASGALALAAVYALACVRLVAILQAIPEGTRRVAKIVLGSLAVAAVGFLAIRFVRVALQDAASSAALATVIDVVAFAVCAVVASRRTGNVPRFMAVVGPPLAVFLAALGLTTLRDPPVGQAIADHAPAYAAAAGPFSPP